MEITKQAVLKALPRRAPEAHKGNFGRVLCVCGCAEYRGAAALSVLGALRCGAGIVTLAAPEIVLSTVAARILEATLLPLPNDEALRAALSRASVVLAGCGLPDTPATRTQMEHVLENTNGTLVLDAGGLRSLAGCEQALRAATAHTQLILTPHAGEMAALAGCEIAEVLRAPAQTALAYARASGAVVVLKLHRTCIAAPDGTLLENTTGNAGLARGGSGDVLAGMVAGLAAIGLPPKEAAMCAVYLHGAAADACAARRSMQAMLPEDILEDLGTLFLEKENGL